MDNQILINQAQHLFVMLRSKQHESHVANNMVFDRLSPVDRFGNRQFQDYQIQGDKVIPVDRFGNKDNSRSSYQKK